MRNGIKKYDYLLKKKVLRKKLWKNWIFSISEKMLQKTTKLIQCGTEYVSLYMLLMENLQVFRQEVLLMTTAAVQNS